MKINFIQLLKDYGIQYWTEGTNCQTGWVNIQCPLCDDKSNHGGFNMAVGNYHCWKCGGHYIQTIIATLLNTTWGKAETIINEYKDRENITTILNKKVKLKRPTTIELPYGSTDLKQIHIDYLNKRKFNHEEIVRQWNLKGTGHLGDYKFRIIIPFYYQEKLVSYQGRDITDRQKLRYKTCKLEDEVICHKHILYGIDKVKNRKTIIMEGVTDVWRMGTGTTCTCGTSYTIQQINFICKHIDNAFILFDMNDPEAQKKAEKLSWLLAGRINVEMLELDINSDPGDLPQDEANYIKKHILG